MFSHRGLNKCKEHFTCSVCFADIEFDHMDEYKDIPALYEKYIDIPCWKMLATALNIGDIKKIYNAHPDKIAGFGELKLYDKFKGYEVNYKHISFARQVCKFSDELGGLPVYIHYELNEPWEVRAMDRLMRDFPDVPIVLCHCGMNDSNQEFAFGAAKKLAAEHGNCWLDLSWDAAKFFSTNPMLITQLPGDRIFWGSDTSPRLEAHGFISAGLPEIKSWHQSIEPYMDSDINLKRLYNENML